MQRTTFQQANDYTGARTVVCSWRARRSAVAAAMARARQDLRVCIGTMSTSNEMWCLFCTHHEVLCNCTIHYSFPGRFRWRRNGLGTTVDACALHPSKRMKVSKRIRMFIWVWCACVNSGAQAASSPPEAAWEGVVQNPRHKMQVALLTEPDSSGIEHVYIIL